VIIIGAISRKVKNAGKQNAGKDMGFQILMESYYILLSEAFQDRFF
jgi:hypothetical protein